ncbi:hypothetical protein Prum_072900 [Phytohabitans rumicis]|uniref:Uncharacterized protein n=1 Tax=Phytohabitans rumicis TaxID=1076125 RepID=A0A6V8LFH4_9ACTN|nr:hypothetical protein Prum_072900 [Phytohabitans rumicis]
MGPGIEATTSTVAAPDEFSGGQSGGQEEGGEHALKAGKLREPVRVKR